jgi:hypothetical protein
MITDCDWWCMVTSWLDESRAGDIASLFGILLTVVGFAVTIRNVHVSSRASLRAEQAAVETRRAIRLFDTIAEVAGAVSALEEIKRLHRDGAWPVLPDRYSALKKSLITFVGQQHFFPMNSKFGYNQPLPFLLKSRRLSKGLGLRQAS